MSDWIILRTSGRHTLGLAALLAKDGFETWTPVETVRMRRRRCHPESEAPSPLMPSYVFARMRHLPELLSLSRNPALTYRIWDSEKRRMVMLGLPFFRIMPGLDTPFATVRDVQLVSLRMIETRSGSKIKVQEFVAGDRVRMTEESYAGLYGRIVEPGKGVHSILIDGWKFPVKVAAYLVHPDVDGQGGDGVSSGVQAPIAKAA